MLALNVILDDGAVQEAFERVEELELADDGVAVVEGLGDDGSKAALQLLDALAEVEEVVVELAALNVHNVVGDCHEFVNNNVEFIEDLSQALAHGGTLGVTDLDLAQFFELLDGTSQVHDVHAALGECVETHEESIGGDLPLVLGLGLVVEVGVLELGADVEGKSEFAVGISSVVILDGVEHLLAINEVLALGNDSIADFADKHNKAGRSVIVVRVLPDKEDSVHDRHEKVSNFGKLK